MKLAMIGLGRMGGNMVEAARERTATSSLPTRAGGGGTAESLEELVGQLEPTRVVWVMVPAGDPTEQVVHELLEPARRGRRDRRRRQLELQALAGRARRLAAERASASSTPASPAGSGASRTATA